MVQESVSIARCDHGTIIPILAHDPAQGTHCLCIKHISKYGAVNCVHCQMTRCTAWPADNLMLTVHLHQAVYLQGCCKHGELKNPEG